MREGILAEEVRRGKDREGEELEKREDVSWKTEKGE